MPMTASDLNGLRHLKTSLIFSPHPDDDVISMGGTLLRLVDQVMKFMLPIKPQVILLFSTMKLFAF